jgi:uroporphyrinogen decarboxylase
MTEAWHSHGLKVIYHSDGNCRQVIADLVNCGVDGSHCLEPAVGMDVVALKKAWPQLVWAGGIDGVNLMEGGTPDQVKREVSRTILETNVLYTGGMFVGTSSEVNPLVKPENFKAMIDSVGEVLNPDFAMI